MTPDTKQVGQCREWLRAELQERRARNPTYSLNAFSRALGISPASLSQILSGKRPLTRKTAAKISSRCAFSPEKSRAFLASAMGIEIPDVALPEEQTEEEAARDGWEHLEIDVFRSISDWRHYAILSLGDVKPNKADPKWIAERLGIGAGEASDAFDRLVRLGLVKITRGGFQQSSRPLTTATVRTAALQKYHLQNLEKAREVLERPSPPLELFSAITMAIDESQLPVARQLIKDFRRRLCEVLETGRRERVYTLAVQLFPICKGEA